VLFLQINHLVKPFLLQVCMLLFPTLAEYFMYSNLPNFLHIVAMLCCSEDEEYFDEDLFQACETPDHLPVARWCPFRCLVLSGLVISFCNKIQFNKHWFYYLFHYLSLYV
jgi:hypothetical protein